MCVSAQASDWAAGGEKRGSRPVSRSPLRLAKACLFLDLPPHNNTQLPCARCTPCSLRKQATSITRGFNRSRALEGKPVLTSQAPGWLTAVSLHMKVFEKMTKRGQKNNTWHFWLHYIRLHCEVKKILTQAKQKKNAALMLRIINSSICPPRKPARKRLCVGLVSPPVCQLNFVWDSVRSYTLAAPY